MPMLRVTLTIQGVCNFRARRCDALRDCRWFSTYERNIFCEVLSRTKTFLTVHWNGDDRLRCSSRRICSTACVVSGCLDADYSDCVARHPRSIGRLLRWAVCNLWAAENPLDGTWCKRGAKRTLQVRRLSSRYITTSTAALNGWRCGKWHAIWYQKSLWRSLSLRPRMITAAPSPLYVCMYVWWLTALQRNKAICAKNPI